MPLPVKPKETEAEKTLRIAADSIADPADMLSKLEEQIAILEQRAEHRRRVAFGTDKTTQSLKAC